jgi:hypothetical protein
MGFTVDLYTFSKEANSTARPTSAAASYSCVIKEPCGILNPTIKLNLGLTANPHTYNYAYIPTFGRYYFIREWTFQDALWHAAMDVDALASWKDSIGNSTCYVLRSAAQFSPAIVDTSYQGTNDTTLDVDFATSPWSISDIANGSFIVGVAGQSTTYYIMTAAALDYLFNYMFSDVYAAALVGAEWLGLYPQLKAQTNPLQYITSIMWVPFTATGTEVTSIRVGWVNIPMSACWKVSGSGLRGGTTTFTIRRHPQAARGEYLNNAPFSHYSLFFPPWGNIPLEADIIANCATLNALTYVDLRTGGGTLAIFGDENHLMSIMHAQVGISYQVSQVLNRGAGGLNLLAPVLSTAANILTGNVAGASATIAAEIGNLAAAKIPSATTIGSMGGMNALTGDPALQYEFKKIVDEDINHRGRPLCSNYKISDLSGYIQVANAAIDIAATQTERTAITGFMEGGFFYE